MTRGKHEKKGGHDVTARLESRTGVESPTSMTDQGQSLAWNALFLMLLLIVCITVWIVHAPSLSARAVFVDDHQYVIDNPLVLNPSRESARRFMTEVMEPSTVRGYYQPLSMISLMLDVAMGGGPENLLPFHRTSLILHVLNVALVAIVLYQLFGNAVVAALVALLFGVHPLTVEPIPWIGERKTLLAAFLGLASIIAYVRYAQRGSRTAYVGSIVLFLLALLAKPTVTMLPIVLMLMDIWPLKRNAGSADGSVARWLRKIMIEKLPHLGLAALFGIITYVSQARTAAVQLPSEYGGGRIPLVVCHNVIFYLRKFLLPVSLSAHYPFPTPLDLTNPVLMWSIVGTVLLVGLIILSLRWTRALTVGWLIFFSAILPTLGVVGFTVVIASDKYAYFPMIGFLMIIASALAWVLRREQARQFGIKQTTSSAKFITIGFVLIVAAFETRATRSYLDKWRDTKTLYAYMLPLAPRAPYLRFSIGHFLYSDGQLAEAETELREALRLDPNYLDAMNNLGLVLADSGRGDEAMALYERALSLSKANPDADVLTNLGMVLQERSRLDEAEAMYREALRVAPRNISAANNLANLLADTSRLEEARGMFEQLTAEGQRRADIANNYGSVLRRLGQLDNAERAFLRAIEIDPRSAAVRYNYGSVLMDMTRYGEAIEQLREANRLAPGTTRVLVKLAKACLASGRIAEAVESSREAIRVAPDDAEAKAILEAAEAGAKK